MSRTKRIVFLIVSAGVLLLTLLLTSCFPGTAVYEGPLEEKTSVVLPEGKEYFVYFEVPCSGLGGSSSSSSARSYPILESILTIYDDTGDSIPNIITSGKIKAYWSETSAGITVARFKLEGNGTRSLELQVDMDAYKQFASLYNKRASGGAPDPLPATAPRQPTKVVISEAGSFSFSPGPIWLTAVVIYGLYLLIKYVTRDKSGGKKEPKTGMPEEEEAYRAREEEAYRAREEEARRKPFSGG